MSNLTLEFEGLTRMFRVDDGLNLDLSWDRNFFNDQDFFDLKDFLIFFKFKELRELSFFEKEYEQYQESLSHIRNWMKTFKVARVDINKKYDIFPGIIKDRFLSSFGELLSAFVLWASKKESYSHFAKYYADHRDSFSLVSSMNYKLKTLEGYKEINLLFAENFRFKSEHGYFNYFNFPKEKRDIIVPQDDESFICMIDFSQFEFRTFLDAVDAEIDYSAEDLYQEVGKTLNMGDDAKIKLISYLYSEHEDESIKKVIDKNALMRKVACEDFEHKGRHVFIPESSGRNKKIHSIIQTLSYFYFLEKFNLVLKEFAEKKSKIIFPLHDAIIFSIHKSEISLIEIISNILESDLYKTKSYVGTDFKNIERYYV